MKYTPFSFLFFVLTFSLLTPKTPAYSLAPTLGSAPDVDTTGVFRRARVLVAKIGDFAQQDRFDSAFRAEAEASVLLANHKDHYLFAELRWKSAELRRTLGRYAEAQVLLDDALAHQPNSYWRARLYGRKAGIFYEDHQGDSALIYVRRSQQLADPKDGWLLFSNHWLLGAIYRGLGRNQEATRELRLALAPPFGSDTANRNIILTQLGLALWKMGKRQAALDTLKMAFEDARRYGVLPQQEYAAHSYFLTLFSTGQEASAQKVLAEYLNVRDSAKARMQRADMALVAAEQTIEHQQAENKILAREKEIREYRLKLTYSLSGSLLVISILLGWFYYSARKKRRLIANQNTILHVQQAELEIKKNHLKQLNDTKTLLLSVVSHDIRGPLQALGMTLHLANQGVLSEEDKELLMTGLADRVKDTEFLLNDVLLWTKTQMDGMHVVTSVQDLGDVVNEVIVQVRPLLLNHELELVTTGTPSEGIADAGLLKVAVRNLLSNAIRYGKKGGSVTVAYRSTNAEAGIAIIDEGGGLPPELVNHLKGPGVAPENARMVVSAGGLGLMLVQDFVRKQHGRMEVETSSAGTSITIWLPKARVGTESRERRYADPSLV